MGPGFFLNFHGFSWCFSMAVGTLYTVSAHSGYKLPWNLGFFFYLFILFFIFLFFFSHFPFCD